MDYDYENIASTADTTGISGSDWMRGIALSITASIIGGASKLFIRKSWLMVEDLPELNSSYLLPLLGFAGNDINSFDTDSQFEVDTDNCVDEEISVFDSIKKKSKLSRGGLSGSNSRICPLLESRIETRNIVGSESNNTETEKRPSSESKMHVELSQLQHQNKQAPKTQNLNDNCAREFNDEYQCSISQTYQNKPSWDTIITTHRRSLVLRFLGMFGMAVINPFCGVKSMLYASPSVLAPFSGLTLVWIVLFSEIFVNEQPLPQQIRAAALIIVGEVIIAAMGDHTNNNNITIVEIEHSYRNPYFIGYFVALFLWLLLLFIAINFGSPTLRRFAWGVSGGSVTGLQNFLKDGLTMLSIVPHNQHYPFFLYMIVISGFLSSIIGLILLTACMKRYDVTYSSSMFVGSFVLSASIMSAIHYKTFKNLQSLWNYFFYPIGVIILLSGVILLALTPKQSRSDKMAGSNPGFKSPITFLCRRRQNNRTPDSNSYRIQLDDPESDISANDKDTMVSTNCS